nr:DUF3820 family protein [Verrucomicrobiota bacterium]
EWVRADGALSYRSTALKAPEFPMMTGDNLRDWMAADLAEIESTWMPFGKFGPAQFPPRGVPICDLPVEYLGWFQKSGWPGGRLGELLRIVHPMKLDGSDSAFDEMRRRRGGKTVLRARRRAS